MNNSSTPRGDDGLTLNFPEALRRLGPSRLVIGPVSGGTAPRVTLSGVHLYANSRYILRVEPPRPEPGETVAVQKLEGNEFFKATDHIEANADTKECKIVFTVSSLMFPLPVRTVLSIPIHHSALGTVSQSISIVIWPTILNQVMWFISAGSVVAFLFNFLFHVLNLSVWGTVGLFAAGIILIISQAIGWFYLFLLSLFSRA